MKNGGGRAAVDKKRNRVMSLRVNLIMRYNAKCVPSLYVNHHYHCIQHETSSEEEAEEVVRVTKKKTSLASKKKAPSSAADSELLSSTTDDVISTNNTASKKFTISSAGVSGSTSKNAAATTWDWRKDLMDLIKSLSGLAKLNRSKASTAAIGNWGIMDVVTRLSEARGAGSYVSARLFMGRKKTAKSKVDVGLSAKDDEATVTAQWNTLR